MLPSISCCLLISSTNVKVLKVLALIQFTRIISATSHWSALIKTIKEFSYVGVSSLFLLLFFSLFLPSFIKSCTADSFKTFDFTGFSADFLWPPIKSSRNHDLYVWTFTFHILKIFQTSRRAPKMLEVLTSFWKIRWKGCLYAISNTVYTAACLHYQFLINAVKLWLSLFFSDQSCSAECMGQITGSLI